MSISRKYRKDPEYAAFVEWLNGPMTELPKSDGAYGEPRVWAFEGLDEWFLYLLWQAARAGLEKEFVQAGVAGPMPGADAWTIAVCKAEDVPANSVIYYRRF